MENLLAQNIENLITAECADRLLAFLRDLLDSANALMNDETLHQIHTAQQLLSFNLVIREGRLHEYLVNNFPTYSAEMTHAVNANPQPNDDNHNPTVENPQQANENPHPIAGNSSAADAGSYLAGENSPHENENSDSSDDNSFSSEEKCAISENIIDETDYSEPDS